METIAALVSMASVLVGAIITGTAYIVTIKLEQRGIKCEVRKLWERVDDAAKKQAQNDLDINSVCKDIQFIKEMLVDIKKQIEENKK